MSENQSQLNELMETAVNEIERLGRAQSVDLREELQLRVWPFLRELVDAITTQTVETRDTSSAATTVAKAIDLLVGLTRFVGSSLSPEDAQALEAKVIETCDELVALVDADELRDYVVQLQTALASPAAAPTERATPAGPAGEGDNG